MKFITKQCWLTPYALSCGYIETTTSKKFSLTLASNMGIGYYVILYDYEEHKRITWECFETLTSARKYFLNYCKKLGILRIRSKYHANISNL